MVAPDVVFGLTGDVRRNSRALKQLRALAEVGATVEVLTFGPPVETPPPGPGIRLRVLPRPAGHGPPFFARVHRLFAQAVRGIPARVYHASDLYTLPAMQASARKYGSRLVYDARECYPHMAATAGRPWVRWFWRAVERRHIHAADAVFTVSESIADHLVGAYAIPRPTVLHNVPPYGPVTSSGYLRRQTAVDAHTALLLHQGQIQQGRGCRLLVDAMRDVQGALLIFMGGGPLKATLEQYVKAAALGDRICLPRPGPARQAAADHRLGRCRHYVARRHLPEPSLCLTQQTVRISDGGAAGTSQRPAGDQGRRDYV